MEKLFYTDSHIREFTARVTGCENQGSLWAVRLDATAFYPEGGGQACDMGTLGGVNVVDVQEEGEEILHFCDGPLEIGTQVTGRIDWARRFDLMQQHTGEHIVSGLLHAKFGCHNTGFHVGADTMEVDFDCLPTWQELQDIEKRANEAVFANLELKCWVPAPHELETVFYRTKRPLPWPVRIVQVPGFDSCACCGVHVKRTGEIGFIKILSAAKFHGGIRLQMVCGGRAYRWMTRIFEENRVVSQTFSAPIEGTAAAVLRFNEALNTEKQRSAQLQGRVFGYIAAGYRGRENVLHFEAGLDSTGVRLLADRIAGEITGFCAVFSETGEGFAYCLAARSGDLRNFNRSMTAALNGRGGGKPNFQQGSVRATRAEIEDFFKKSRENL